ncbi:hypothetical protein [Acinetobacter sp. YH16038]|uniref:hypothetical protein n=1 Tax=Acinetobacter sp. YH16038 TaxID=2601183 RepID=UPI0015D3FE1F|nr:hypothetical protein [Acinetobacter sp. YH16038]
MSTLQCIHTTDYLISVINSNVINFNNPYFEFKEARKEMSAKTLVEVERYYQYSAIDLTITQVNGWVEFKAKLKS